jgi:hypothetical protein
VAAHLRDHVWEDGEFGARSVANEVLVGKRSLSAYTQTVRRTGPTTPSRTLGEAGVPRRQDHHTLFFDNSMMADDAARADRRASSAVHDRSKT